MHLAAVMLLSSILVPVDAAADHQRFMALHHEWQRIHESAARERIPPNAVLVFDPREGAIWIEKDGKIDANDVRPLPSGLDWFAYHVTPQGVAQISFPVRISRLRQHIQDENDAEHIWMIGATKDQSWQCSVSASAASHGFHVGSGSPISSLTFTLPVVKAPSPLHDSILVSGSPHARKWADTMTNKWFSINVVRSAAAR